MAKGPNYEWEVIEAALSSTAAGFTQVETAALLGIKQTTISSWMRKAKDNELQPRRGRPWRVEVGRDPNPVGRPPTFGDEVRRQAIIMASRGSTLREIAELLGISHETARLWARAAGVHSRGRGAPPVDDALPLPMIPVYV